MYVLVLRSPSYASPWPRTIGCTQRRRWLSPTVPRCTAVRTQGCGESASWTVSTPKSLLHPPTSFIHDNNPVTDDLDSPPPHYHFGNVHYDSPCSTWQCSQETYSWISDVTAVKLLAQHWSNTGPLSSSVIAGDVLQSGSDISACVTWSRCQTCPAGFSR